MTIAVDWDIKNHTKNPALWDHAHINEIFISQQKTYVIGTQKNRLIETVLLSTRNICLNLWLRK